jgi:lipoprotein-anchoring transpeptidase ErfK/SrfK
MSFSRMSWLVGVVAFGVSAGPAVVAAQADDPASTTAPPPSTTVPAPTVPAPVSPIAPPSKATGATVARIVAPTTAHPRLDAPRGKGRRVGTQTSWSHQSQTLLVLEGATRDGVDYVKVLLPTRPNGSAGWIPRDRVVLSKTPYWVQVRVRKRTVSVFRRGKRVLTTRAVVGKPKTPTPRGLAAIYERNRQPDPKGFLGPWALSLTSLSNVLESYGGGPGRVAIHGRDGASFADPLGTARSHGCIRINNKPVSWMARHLVQGTPVDVVAG